MVIAILSILAALLLPALENALTQARILTCMNHNKQLGIRVNLYANEYAVLPFCQPAAEANHYCTGLDRVWIDALETAGVLDARTDAFCPFVRERYYRSDGTSYYYGWRLHYSDYEWGLRISDEEIYFPYRWFGPMAPVAQNGNDGFGYLYLQDWRVFDHHSASDAVKEIRDETSKKEGGSYFRTRLDHGRALLTTCVDPKRVGDTEEGFFGHEDQMMVTPAGVRTNVDLRTYLMSDGSGGIINR